MVTDSMIGSSHFKLHALHYKVLEGELHLFVVIYYTTYKVHTQEIEK